jgi:hypothetical protein
MDKFALQYLLRSTELDTWPFHNERGDVFYCLGDQFEPGPNKESLKSVLEYFVHEGIPSTSIEVVKFDEIGETKSFPRVAKL